jgi:GT2 family glycosyltransferase
MRSMLETIQSSKFWTLRNAWFRLKKGLKIDATGEMPLWLPDVAEFRDGETAPLPYERWMLEHRVRAADRRRMRNISAVLPHRPLLSVIMPVYDAPEQYLREAIESVIGQAYEHWELCIADDASPGTRVRAILEGYARTDSRIKLAFRTVNGHIAEASNTALELATGEFVALLDHDDVLAPDAFFEIAVAVNRQPDVDVIYSDEDKIDERGRRTMPYFKPDWSPDSLLARNYVSHLGVYRRSLVTELGGFRTGFEGSQDYDLLLRVTEHTERVAHIPHVLYHWRLHAGSTAAARTQKTYAYDAGRRALEEALERRGESGRVIHDELRTGLYSIRYAIRDPGDVCVIIPTRDHGDDLGRCLTALFERTTYPRFEVLVIDNGTTDPASLAILADWSNREPDRMRIERYDVPFNFSRINNFGATKTSAAYLLFLNNDTEIVTPDWIEAMIEQAQRPCIGAVGAKLLYADGTIQHAGVVVGLGGVAGHGHKHAQAEEPGYFFTLQATNNVSAVTAACLMVRRDVFEQVGGFDEQLAIAFNDVDLCLRILAAGYRNIYLPHVVLYHYESKSRGYEDTPEKQNRFAREQQYMRTRWKTDTEPDPYYNINLSRDTENYEIGI